MSPKWTYFTFIKRKMYLSKTYVPDKMCLSDRKVLLKNWPQGSYHSEQRLLWGTIRRAGVAADLPSLCWGFYAHGPFQVIAYRSSSLGRVCNFPTLLLRFVIYIPKDYLLPEPPGHSVNLLHGPQLPGYLAQKHNIRSCQWIKSQAWRIHVVGDKLSFPRALFQYFLSLKFHIFTFLKGTILQKMLYYDLIGNSPHEEELFNSWYICRCERWKG